MLARPPDARQPPASCDSVACSSVERGVEVGSSVKGSTVPRAAARGTAVVHLRIALQYRTLSGAEGRYTAIRVCLRLALGVAWWVRLRGRPVRSSGVPNRQPRPTAVGAHATRAPRRQPVSHLGPRAQQSAPADGTPDSAPRPPQPGSTPSAHRPGPGALPVPQSTAQ